MIDTHLHLWDPSRLSYDWLQYVPTIAGRHTAPEWRAIAADIEASIFVQADCAPSQALDEAAWVDEQAETARIAGIVAYAPLETGTAVGAHLDALAAIPRVRGVRRSIQNEADGFVLMPAYIDGMVEAARRGLSLDVCARDHQLPDLIRALDVLYEREPDATVILDHLGKPDINAHHGDINGANWAANIQTLARFPGVYAKISGLTTQADWADWQTATLLPYIGHALHVFGPDRCLYGGDWPVVDLAGGLARWRSVFEQAMTTLSPDAANLIRTHTARRVYRL